jgi:hypothetical protein
MELGRSRANARQVIPISDRQEPVENRPQAVAIAVASGAPPAANTLNIRKYYYAR